MQKEAMRLSDIIDDLLELSRIEDDSEPEREPVSIPVVIAQAVERVRSLADHRGITVTSGDPATAVAVAVPGDRRQLVSAVHNLLENAVKYSDDDSAVEVLVEREGGWVSVAVRDHGIGIPSRDISRIFERFYRVDRARARDTRTWRALPGCSGCSSGHSTSTSREALHPTCGSSARSAREKRFMLRSMPPYRKRSLR